MKKSAGLVFYIPIKYFIIFSLIMAQNAKKRTHIVISTRKINRYFKKSD